MDTFIPETIKEEEWTPLLQKRDYAIFCDNHESVCLRFGQRHGLYLTIDPSPAGRVMNAVTYSDGSASLLGKLAAEGKSIAGRTSECQVKIMHPVVSRHHLEVAFYGRIAVVRDLGSTNGTYLLKQISHFDIDEYIENHPPDKASTNTMDPIAEAFGPDLADFLKTYSQSKGNN